MAETAKEEEGEEEEEEAAAATQEQQQNSRFHFPLSPSSFDQDPRISYSRREQRHILETEDGREYEWDTALRRWIPVVSGTHTASPLRISQNSLDPFLLHHLLPITEVGKGTTSRLPLDEMVDVRNLKTQC